MNKRLISLLAVLALLGAACTGTTQNTTSTGSVDEPTTTGSDATTTVSPTTTQVEGAPEAVLLSYSLEAGRQFQYEVELNQHIEMTATGDESLMGGELPGQAVIDVSGTATFSHLVSDGPEPGTYQITITGDFTGIEVTGTIDGESVDSGVAPEFAAIEPVNVTVLVDEQGNVIQGVQAPDDPLAGIFGDPGALGSSSPAPSLDPGQFIGPPFPDEEVTVGDNWSEEIETPGLAGEPIVTTVTSTVTGVDEIDGTGVLVIESTATTTPIELDLAEFFVGMFGAFTPEDATEEETAALDQMLAELKFLISVDETIANSTTLFDAEAGIVRQSEMTAGTRITMDMTIPDETTGELIGFQTDMTLDQEIVYRLISDSAA